MAETLTVGVVGLGAMGSGMARSAVRAGFKTIGFDLSQERRDLAAAEGILPAQTLEEVFSADRIVFSLPTAQDVARVVAQVEPLLQSRARLVIIDTSTSEPDVSRALASTLAALGHGFVDAPVSGGPAGAAQGALTMMLGGAEADVADARPVLEALSAKIFHVGASGAGNVAKLVNNMLCATHLVTAREGLRLAEAAGISAEAVLEVLNAASGGSTVSQVHVPNWVMNEAYNSGFTMALMQKDVRLARKLTQELALDLPLTAEAAQLWEESDYAPSDDFTQMANFRKH